MISKEIISVVKECLPPALTSTLQKWRGGRIRFEGDFPSWEAAAARCTGYDAEHILAKVLDATLKVKRGEAVFERDSVLFDKIEYAWPVTAGLMWAAAKNGGKLNVLDFGGALGSSYFQNRKFLQSLPEVHWNVVEQAHYAAAGRQHIQDDVVHFFSTVDECLLENQPNVILLSGVLQYLPDSQNLLRQFSEMDSEVIIMDRVPYLNVGKEHVVTIQYVPEAIYSASYPCRFFIEPKIVSAMQDAGYQLLEVFSSLDRLSPIATWKGHIFFRSRQ